MSYIGCDAFVNGYIDKVKCDVIIKGTNEHYWGYLIRHYGRLFNDENMLEFLCSDGKKKVFIPRENVSAIKFEGEFDELGNEKHGTFAVKM